MPFEQVVGGARGPSTTIYDGGDADDAQDVKVNSLSSNTCNQCSIIWFTTVTSPSANSVVLMYGGIIVRGTGFQRYVDS